MERLDRRERGAERSETKRNKQRNKGTCGQAPRWPSPASGSPEPLVTGAPAAGIGEEPILGDGLRAPGVLMALPGSGGFAGKGSFPPAEQICVWAFPWAPPALQAAQTCSHQCRFRSFFKLLFFSFLTDPDFSV